MRCVQFVIAVLSVIWLAGCQTGRRSTSGFRLPPDGDAERGKLAFVAHKCHDCHTVAGVDLPKSEAEGTIPIPLGGPVAAAVSDSHLFTSIAYPAYKLANFPKEQTTVNGRSRMPPCAERMTVREITDIVEFLQAHYEIREVARPAYY
jgi:mono/diheme cytochrome c family protein